MVTSFMFSMKKAYRRVTTTKPSLPLIALLVAAAAILLIGGEIYDIIVSPILAFPLGSTWVFYYPSVHDQTLTESVGAITMFAVGFLGFLMVYQSTKYAYKPRQAFTWLSMGAMCIVLAYIYTEIIMILKLTAYR
jgi:hypothetical protein